MTDKDIVKFLKHNKDMVSEDNIDMFVKCTEEESKKYIRAIRKHMDFLIDLVKSYGLSK